MKLAFYLKIDKGKYVFRDWVPSDGEYAEDFVLQKQLEIIQTIKKYGTKFVFCFSVKCLDKKYFIK